MAALLLAEFDTPERLARAIADLRALGCLRIDAFTPYPAREVERALGLSRSPLNWAVLGFGILGASIAYFVQWWCDAYDYPLDVGGRPLDSVPAFIPITFEMGVLSAAISGFVLWLLFSRLPELHHPIFEVEGFERASIDRFWVSVDERDPCFDREGIERGFRALGALTVAYAGEPAE